MKKLDLHISRPEQIIELIEELEARIVDLLDLVKEREWHQSAVAAAVTSLAGNYMKKLEANLQTDIDIARAIRRLQEKRRFCPFNAPRRD